ncbi:MAG: ankyrin repeat domain-containing protein [Bdellovibrionia bacterium]
MATDLHDEAKAGDIRKVETLIRQGSDVNAKNEDGDTPLHVAAKWGHTPIIEVLIRKGADVNVRSKNLSTPLHYAADKGHSATMDVLIKNGADPNRKDVFAKTPLQLYKAKTGRHFPYEAKAILHDEAKAGDISKVETLIRQGSDVNAKNEDGETPLHVAANWGHTPIIEVLIRKGANVNAKSPFGSTALHYAADKGHSATADALIKNGADPNIQNVFGQTPLQQYKAKTGRPLNSMGPAKADQGRARQVISREEKEKQEIIAEAIARQKVLDEKREWINGKRKVVSADPAKADQVRARQVISREEKEKQEIIAEAIARQKVLDEEREKQILNVHGFFKQAPARGNAYAQPYITPEKHGIGRQECHTEYTNAKIENLNKVIGLIDHRFSAATGSSISQTNLEESINSRKDVSNNSSRRSSNSSEYSRKDASNNSSRRSSVSSEYSRKDASNRSSRRSSVSSEPDLGNNIEKMYAEAKRIGATGNLHWNPVRNEHFDPRPRNLSKEEIIQYQNNSRNEELQGKARNAQIIKEAGDKWRSETERRTGGRVVPCPKYSAATWCEIVNGVLLQHN